MDDEPATQPGKSVLVVEDEALVAIMLEEMLGDLGYQVIGPVASVGAALALYAQGRPDAAILDINLGGEHSFAVADALREGGVPFAFSTGYDSTDEVVRSAAAYLLMKPYRMEELQDLMAVMLPG
jgi:DNA-binding response OmpR family regulator